MDDDVLHQLWYWEEDRAPHVACLKRTPGPTTFGDFTCAVFVSAETLAELESRGLLND